MADFVSQYSGQEIENLLTSIKDKIDKVDIVDDSAVGVSDTPASSRLVKELYDKLKDVDQLLTDKVMRIDGKEQTVNGKKVFATGIEMTNVAKIVQPYEATSNNELANFKVLKKYGLNLPQTSRKGLKVVAVADDFSSITLDFDTVDGMPANLLASNAKFMAAVGGVSYAVTYGAVVTAIFKETQFTGKLDKTVFDAKMVTVDADIASRVLVSNYNIDMVAMNTAINARVLTTTYNAYVTSNNTAVALKLAISDFDIFKATNTATIATKLDITDFNTNLASINASINLKLNITDFNTFSASNTAAINAKLATSTYNSFVSDYNSDLSATNAALAARVLTTTYNVDLAATNAALSARVLSTTYNAFVTTTNQELAKKLADNYEGTSTIAVSGSYIRTFAAGTVGIYRKATVVLVYSDGSVDAYEINICGGSATTATLNKNSSNTLTVTYAISSGVGTLTIKHSSTSAATIYYRYLQTFI